MTFEKFIIQRLQHKISSVHFEHYDNLTFNKIAETPGIYSWHIAPHNISSNFMQRRGSLASYTAFFKPNDITLSGSNYFNRYDGKISENVSEKDAFQQKIDILADLQDSKYLELLTSLFLFSSPLYIGISDNLN